MEEEVEEEAVVEEEEEEEEEELKVVPIELEQGQVRRQLATIDFRNPNLIALCISEILRLPSH